MAASAGSASPVTFNLTNTAGAAYQLVNATGGGQTAQIGTQFTNSLSVTVQDQNGNPVPGVTVNFQAATVSGPSGTFLQSSGTQAAVYGVTTDANGLATSSKFTANNTQGTYTVTASVVGSTSVKPATFSLTNTVASAGSITASGGTPQSTVVGTAFATSLQATVKDTGGNLLNNVPVTFTAPSGTNAQSGIFQNNTNTQTINTVNGVASIAINANTYAGAFAVTATAQGVTQQATYLLTNTPAAAPVVKVQNGSNQTAPVLTAFLNQLQVLVTDASGNPLAGVTVTFQAPSTGASGRFVTGSTSATGVTNANGIASSPTFVANGTAGNDNVTATYLSVSANFSLSNTANARLVIDPTPVSGSGQSTPVTKAFALPLAVRVTDGGGNALPNVQVTFAAPATGPSGTLRMARLILKPQMPAASPHRPSLPPTLRLGPIQFLLTSQATRPSPRRNSRSPISRMALSRLP